MKFREFSSKCCVAALLAASGCASGQDADKVDDNVVPTDTGTTGPMMTTPPGMDTGTTTPPGTGPAPGTVVTPEPNAQPEPDGVNPPSQVNNPVEPPVPVGNGGTPSVPPPNGGTPSVPPTPVVAGAGPVGTAGGGSEPEPVVTTDCTIAATPSTAADIASVGIVEFTTDIAAPAEAHIEFGLDTTYGMTAPVDLAAANYRTLVLGMKPSSEYHARVVVDGCAGPDFTLQTGAQATGLPNITFDTPDEGAVAGGFMVTGTYQTGPAYILDKDGDFVWWWPGEGEVTRARMSYDGKYMWYAKGNVPEGMSKVVRISMDGSEREDMSSQLPRLNHDLTVLPDGRVIFVAYGDNGCDDVVEWADGANRTIANTGDILGANMCHCNAIQYSPEDETVVVSELDNNAYIKLSLEGEVVWVLGGGGSNDFTGDGSTWSRQHNLHVLGVDKLLFFNNGDMGGGPGSLAVELQLDLGAMTATRTWEYAAMPGIQNAIMGDVQRLWNGNTLVTYSTQGIVHEVTAEGTLVQSLSWGLGGAIGYVEKRQTLYGPPPK